MDASRQTCYEHEMKKVFGSLQVTLRYSSQQSLMHVTKVDATRSFKPEAQDYNERSLRFSSSHTSLRFEPASFRLQARH